MENRFRFQTFKPLVITTASLIPALLAGWLLRDQFLFTPGLIPGINGGYYPVQVRAILQQGTLGIPDFPLLFYGQAALAWLLSLFAEDSAAILFAVKFVDTLLPPLLAVPAGLFVYEFWRSKPAEQRSLAGLALAAGLVSLAAAANANLMRMAGDFQKNAAALFFSLLFMLFFYRSLALGGRRNAILAGLFFGLTCLTHLGSAAMILTFTALAALISLLGGTERRRTLLGILVLFLILATSMGAAALFDPNRVARLFGMFFSPEQALDSSLLGNMTPGGPFLVLMGLPPAEGSAYLLSAVLALLGLFTIALFRRRLSAAEVVLLWAAVLTNLLFVFPVFNREWLQRLSLMAFVPGLIPLAFLSVRRDWLIALPIAALTLSAAFQSLAQPVQQTLTGFAYDELQEFRSELPGEHSLIVAVHGLEWWAAWAMETDITNRIALAGEHWDQYPAVYVLEMTNPAAFRGQPFSWGLQAGLDQQKQTGNNVFSPGPAVIRPPSAVTVRQGSYFRLSRLTERPASIGERPEAPGSSLPGIPQASEPQPEEHGTGEVVALGPLKMVTRAGWGAMPLNLNARTENGAFDPITNPGGVLIYPEPLEDWLRTIIVHHSALPLTEGPYEIQQFHFEERGFADVAYHFMIGRDGMLYEGRPLNIRGAHTADFNTGSVGVLLIGNFEVLEPTEAQLETLDSLVAFLSKTFGITHLAGHRDFNPGDTECPGKNLYWRLPGTAERNGLIYGTGGYVAPQWQ